jgi:hypothetical protein
MRFFIGAKDSKGKQAVAEMIEAQDFDAAYARAIARATEERPDGDFRITAVNEQQVFET